MNDDMDSELPGLWREAADCIDDLDFDKAFGIYHYILIRYGGDRAATGRAHAGLSELLLLFRDNYRALQHAEKALSCDEENTEYRYLLARVYFRLAEGCLTLGDTAQAESYIQRGSWTTSSGKPA